MSKASEEKLAALHGKLAEVMTSSLDQAGRAEGLLVDLQSVDWEDEDERTAFLSRLEDFLEKCTEVNPALLTVAAKFLKDNNITSDPSTDAGLQDLQEKLDSKKNNSRSKVADLAIN